MDSSLSYNDDEHIESHLSKTQSLELAYQEVIRNTDFLIKDESARRLRLQILMLENENDDLHKQLSLENDNVDALEQETEEQRGQLMSTQEEINRQESQIRSQARELAIVKAELKSMNGVTSDSARLLTEKLSLSRELATLKPELEHLRSQVTYQQTILAEKLALERQISTIEVELEAEKRASKRAAKKSNSQERELELQNQVDELHKDLTKEKRENAMARKDADADFQSRFDELQKELAKEKRERKKSRDGAEINLQNQIEDLQKELAQQKRGVEKARSEVEADLRNQLEELQENLTRQKRDSAKARKNGNSDLQEQLDTLQQDLLREKTECEKLRKELEKARKLANSDLDERLQTSQQDLVREKKEAERFRKDAEKDRKATETQNTILESKLDQFRTKLRSTKEELKECQTELTQVKAAADKASRTDVQVSLPVKNSRKRVASGVDDDMVIGTPDGGAARGKRQKAKNRRAEQTMVGEKSMFSITPFLNRTMSMAPDTPGEEDIDSPAAAKTNRNNTEEKIAPSVNTSRSNALDSSLKNIPAIKPSGLQLSPDIQDSGASTHSAAGQQVDDDDALVLKSRGKKKTAEKVDGSSRPILGEAKSNAKAKKPTLKAMRAASKLEKVTEEEEDEENEHLVNDMPPAKIFTGKDFAKPPPSKPAKSMALDDAGAKKKKRKLGDGKTLFDDDDGEATKRPAKVTLGAPRLLSKGGLAGPKGGLRGGLNNANGFGGFSPLKKDRRGVGASFLG